MTLLFWIAVASAGDVFGTVGPETTYGRGGGWARFYAVNEGYWYFQVSGGDGWVDLVNDDLSGYDDRNRTQLTQHGALQDVQMERCPDGGWLLVGSYTKTAFDDSAQAWRYESDFTQRWTLVVAESDDSQAHNDMVPVCSTAGEGTIFANAHGSMNSTAVYVDFIGGSVQDTTALPDVAAEGASWAQTADGGHVVVEVPGPGHDYVRIHEYDAAWTAGEVTQVSLPGGSNLIWPQRIAAYGEGWLLIYLASDANDGQGGRVWMAALDADFQLLDSHQITDDGVGNHRPWFARKGSTLALTYERNVQPYARLADLGSDGGDDGIPDTADPGGDGEGDDTGEADSADTAGELACMCGPGGVRGAGGAALVAGLAAAVARRPRRR